jgi:lipopolysaccharide exporter
MQESVRYDVAWSMAAIIGKNGCMIVTYMLLARLLEPASFGLIAVTMVAMGLTYSFINSGFTSVIVRMPTIDRNQLSSLYWFTLGIAAAAIGLLVLAAFPVARLFQSHQLVRLMPLAAVALAAAALGQQHVALMQRERAFMTIALIETGSSLVALAVAVVRAFFGTGPAAYFEGLVAGNAVASVCAIVLGRRLFMPRLFFSHHDLGMLMSFGLFNTAERFINYVSGNLEKPIMGRLFSLELLGLYTVVNQLVTRPLMFFSGAFSRVAYPLYSGLQQQPLSLNALYIAYTGKLALIVFPVYGFFYLFRDTVLLVLFGKTFLPAQEYMLPLCFLGAVWSIGNPLGSYLMALNRAKIGFFFNLFSACLTLVVFLAGSRFSLTTMLWIWIASVVSLVLPVEWMIRYRLTKMSAWRYAAGFLPHAAVIVFICWFIEMVRVHAGYGRPFPIVAAEMILYCAVCTVYCVYCFRRGARIERKTA